MLKIWGRLTSVTLKKVIWENLKFRQMRLFQVKFSMQERHSCWQKRLPTVKVASYTSIQTGHMWLFKMIPEKTLNKMEKLLAIEIKAKLRTATASILCCSRSCSNARRINSSTSWLVYGKSFSLSRKKMSCCVVIKISHRRTRQKNNIEDNLYTSRN